MTALDRHGSGELIELRPGSPDPAQEDGLRSTSLINAEVVVEVGVGVGARPGVTADDVLAAVDAVLPAGARVLGLATVDRRAAEPGVRGA
ncbi:cobalamin biosynthesis protein, partial [Klenkia sp. PcliD-1-E]|uniref:cobalamin biosynthesis protein n=1 Tax=Klenkia sp. PcliD-1-E TaxID=2954492 RepID=UPI002097FEB8